MNIKRWTKVHSTYWHYDLTVDVIDGQPIVVDVAGRVVECLRPIAELYRDKLFDCPLELAIEYESSGYYVPADLRQCTPPEREEVRIIIAAWLSTEHGRIPICNQMLQALIAEYQERVDSCEEVPAGAL